MCVSVEGPVEGPVLSAKAMHTVTRVQILDDADCMSHITNTLETCMNPIILPQAMGKNRAD